MAPEHGAGRPALSLVVPAYDEAARIDDSLRRIAGWAPSWPGPVELLLCDDGSGDDTLARLRGFAEGQPGARVLACPHRGKAATVTAGMLAAAGDLVLFSDADLSTPLEEATALAAAIRDGADVAIGSREARGARREAEPGYRHLLGRGFNWLVRALVVGGIKDTQCGFKMFTRAAAQAIFRRLRRYGPDAPLVRGPMVTAFDVEVLLVARKLGLRVAEVPVRWVHAEGSKVRPVVDALRMGRDVVMVKLGDLRGDYEPAGPAA
jgi:dolichyl-phosphate beta-glucosyltransferase